jgi:hypothetical protein
MCDPGSFHSPMDFCVERELAVDCPVRMIKANVTIARWRKRAGELTPWSVVDCSLLPAGQVSCCMDCLADMDEVSGL